MITLDTAVVYDIEAFPNCFLLTAETLYGDAISTWEISEFRDDRLYLLRWLEYCRAKQVVMIGFNNLGYDYPMTHYLMQNPNATYADLYAKNQQIIGGSDGNRFGQMIWDRDRLAPQCDLFKIHHFDNMAKKTSLKALQINMRSPNVKESPIPFGTVLTQQQINDDIIPYNIHDVKETKKFAHISLGAVEFRINLIKQFGIDVLNYNDTKIGEKTLEQRLGDDVCYYRDHNDRRQRRQTIRTSINLGEIIFPYVRFDNPEFDRVLKFMQSQTLRPEDLDDPEAKVQTKGVFKGLTADVGGLEFVFGTGGVHASVSAKRFMSDDDWMIRDIDVEGLYPNVAIVNRLAPAHLGERYIAEYAKIPQERKLHAKGTYLNALFKLAANGAWGKSNSMFSCFFDSQYAMTIPINGQLMICMLAERLVTVPTLQLIQANTDGITYRIHRSYLEQAKAIETDWQALTCLKLEDVSYNRMWIRDVNNYVAEDVKGKLKLKGAYWSPDAGDYENSISTASPPCWYKDFNPCVTARAAVNAMVHNVEPEHYMRLHHDPFDFICRAKVDRSSNLILGNRELQRTSRYYVALDGAPLVKVSPPPPGHTVGQWKRAPKVTLAEYNRVMAETGGVWDARVCTKAQTRFEDRRTAIEAGWHVAECNDIRDFKFSNVNYDWYVNESRKLIVV